MAFLRKDVKKSSYYVWFLGAKESKGIRGDEYVLPVLHYLLDKEREYEPSKVTLQISSKGLKIIQNVPKYKHFLPLPLLSHHHNQQPDQSALRGHHQRSPSVQSSSAKSSSCQSDKGSSAIKMEIIKHLIPSTAITCVAQEDDIVCVIMLLFNPITKCPIHMHAYRCDSVETASALKGQLNVLINRPENQKKFAEIEEKLKARTAQLEMVNRSSSSVKHNHCPANQGTNCAAGSSGRRSDSHNRYNGSDGITSPTSSASPQRSKGSDGRSIRTAESDDSFDSFPRRIVGHPSASPVRGSAYPCGKCPASRASSDNKLLKIKRSSSSSAGNHKLLSSKPASKSQSKIHTSSSSAHPDPFLDPKAAIFESLAHELKVKLENKKKIGPLLLPPRDYDTIHRTRGNLLGIDERKSTNKLLVGQVVNRSSINDSNLIKDRTQKIITGMAATKLDKADPHAADNEVNYQTRSESSGMSSGIGSDEAIPKLNSTADGKMVRSRSDKVIYDKDMTLSHKTLHESSASEGEEEDDENLWLSSSDTKMLDIYGSNLDNEDIEPDYDQDEDVGDQTPKYYYFPDPRFVADESNKVSKSKQTTSSSHHRDPYHDNHGKRYEYFGASPSRQFPPSSSSSHFHNHRMHQQPVASSSLSSVSNRRNSYGH